MPNITMSMTLPSGMLDANIGRCYAVGTLTVRVSHYDDETREVCVYDADRNEFTLSLVQVPASTYVSEGDMTAIHATAGYGIVVPIADGLTADEADLIAWRREQQRDEY